MSSLAGNRTVACTSGFGPIGRNPVRNGPDAAKTMPMNRSTLGAVAGFAGNVALVAGGAVIAGTGLALLCFALPIAAVLLCGLLVMRAIVHALPRPLAERRAQRLLGTDWWGQFEHDLHWYMDPAVARARRRERQL